MKTSINPLAKSMLLTLAIAAAPALAGGPSTTGALATKANRIVGTWAAVGDVNGTNCLSGIPGPALQPRVYLVYHAGGTLTELPRLPVSTSPAPRTIGVGNWYYDNESDTYYVSFRFDWYEAGVLKGYATVDREIKLHENGDSLAGSVVAVRYREDGTEVFSQCGTGTATRF